MSADVMPGMETQEAWSQDAYIPPSPSLTHYGTYGAPIAPTGRLGRPKSVPPKLHRDRQSSAINKSRPKTATGHNQSDCDRVLQVEHESTRKHNLDAHLPTKKQRPPPWQTKMDPPPVPCVVTPGYILAKSKSKVAMYIKTDEFFEPPIQEEAGSNASSKFTHLRTVAEAKWLKSLDKSSVSAPAERAALPPSKRQVHARHPSADPVYHSADPRYSVRSDPVRDSLISQLQQQIDDLTLFLEEERINHKETKRKAADHLRDRIEDTTNQHANEVKILVDQHREEKESLLTKHAEDMQEQEEKSAAIIDKMKGEIIFLQGAFDSFKTQLHIETTDKWKSKEDELKQQYEDKMQEKLHELKQKMLLDRSRDHSDNAKEHSREIYELKKVHRKEMEALVRRYSNAAEDYEKLLQTEKILQDRENQISDMHKEYDEVCQEVTELTRELTDAQVKLLSFEESFSQRVQEIDEKYKDQIDELMAQNADLKRLYVKKCGQLYQEKTEAEKARMEQVETAKDTIKTIITTRNNAIVNLAAQDPDLEKRARPPKHRPVSAPNTKQENEKAQLSAGETDKYVKSRQERARPHTSKPRILEAIEREKEEGTSAEKVSREQMQRILRGEK